MVEQLSLQRLNIIDKSLWIRRAIQAIQMLQRLNSQWSASY